jgi:hypothetical protein
MSVDTQVYPEMLLSLTTQRVFVVLSSTESLSFSCRSRTVQQQEAPENGTASLNSSPHSSLSDVSVSQSHALGKASTKSSSSLSE